MATFTPKPKRECWANALGDCDTLSREHVISRSVFAHGCDCPHIVEGVHRIPTGHLPESAQVAKILCRKHNSALAPLDAEAGRLAELLLNSARGQQIGRPEVDGALIERWAFKTLINSLAAGWTDKRKWLPHADLTRFIFGQGNVPKGCGLYSVDGGSEDLQNIQQASITPVWLGTDIMTKQLAGGYVRIHGLRFCVATHGTIVEHMAGAKEDPEHVFEGPSMRFVYRPAFVSVGELGSNRNGLILRWPDIASNAA